jgi:restriction endonuclease Mrr
MQIVRADSSATRQSHAASSASPSRSTTPNDGTEPARLMIAHGVGVTPAAVYELKRVDSDYFAEE